MKKTTISTSGCRTRKRRLSTGEEVTRPSEYIRGLVYSDVPEEGLKSALRKYIET